MRRIGFGFLISIYLALLATFIYAQPVFNSQFELNEQTKGDLERIYRSTQSAALLVETVPEGVGSAFFISPDGYVITAYHVVREAKRFRVVTPKQERFDAALIGYDEYRDLALLKADLKGRSVPFLPLELDRAVKIGDPVVAIGNSKNEFIASRPGLVKALDKSIRADFPAGMVASTMPLAPGDSGGPVVNLEGKTVAVVVAIGNDGNEFSSYLAPLAGLGNFIQELRAGYTRDAPYIGVSPMEITSELARELRIPPGGLLVRWVIPGSAAAKAGLQSPSSVPGTAAGAVALDVDVILSIDGTITNTFADLVAYVRSKRVGDTINLRIRRGERVMTIPVTLAPRPK
jgi:S1-C subfamily serine protease